MKTFRTLELAIQFHHHVEKLKMPYYLKNQLVRASSSIALNLSEGHAKLSKKDKNRFYFIALGSTRECQTLLKLARVSERLFLRNRQRVQLIRNRSLTVRREMY